MNRNALVASGAFGQVVGGDVGGRVRRVVPKRLLLLVDFGETEVGAVLFVKDVVEAGGWAPFAGSGFAR